MSSRPFAFARNLIRNSLRRFGYDIAAYNPDHVPEDIDLREEEAESGVFAAVSPYTMTSLANVSACCGAIRHIVASGLPGAIVECGVWRGGSMMAAAMQLLKLGVTDRELYLFDTFEGLPEPTERDVTRDGVAAREALQVNQDAEGRWCRAGIDEVRVNLATTRYPAERIHFVEGLVEETLPDAAPDRIALLRLDTDFYESTRHELIHLFPRLVPGGVLIIDDYGYWQGARQATDEYLQEHNISLLLCRIDHGARMAVKLPDGL